MEDEKIDFKTALILKELEFDIPTSDFLRLDSDKIINFCKQDYKLNFGQLLFKNNKDISDFLYSSKEKPVYFTEGKDPLFMNHPTQSLLQKWLREKHKIYLFIQTIIGDNYLFFYYTIKADAFSIHEIGRYKTYEEALEFGLVDCLKRVPKTVA